VPYSPTLPGPGQYKEDDPFRSFGSKLVKKNQFSVERASRKELWSVNNNPGPGEYKPATSKVSTIVIKKDINPNANNPTSSRVLRKIGPGPQDYDYDIRFNNSQRNFLDIKPVYGGSKFPKSTRKIFEPKNNDTPGPGTYLAPSLFGQYIDKNAFSEMMSKTQGSFTRSISSQKEFIENETI